ncbi:MAG TPA: oligopeptide/dipeptide ABC transporter ATP-binding protein [Burkholderiales bacterium]|jgi:peptide/nickel transport system ATP-binding protein|nr:oligopeptide/dipeptide ABC transporter ATP-binding protein [Burkholderiales bacterium]
MANATDNRPLLRLSEVSKDFDVSRPWLNRMIEGAPQQLLRAVDGMSFELRRGETLALVGESGCGKSTVARLIVGLYAPTQGRIEFDGIDLALPGAAALRRRMQMIFQDPYASLNPRWRVMDIVAEPIRVLGLASSAAEIERRVAELLVQVGLAREDREKYPHEFSGGQRQRISIARALSGSPEFLVCDEPTSALDVSVQAQILNLMTTLQETLGLTYLFISHNLAVVSHVADRVGVMYLGRLAELSDADELFARPKHPYTRMLLDAIPDLQMSGKARTPVAGEVPNPLNPPSGCAFHPRCPHANERCRVERPAALPHGASLVTCHAVHEGRIQV